MKSADDWLACGQVRTQLAIVTLSGLGSSEPCPESLTRSGLGRQFCELTANFVRLSILSLFQVVTGSHLRRIFDSNRASASDVADRLPRAFEDQNGYRWPGQHRAMGR